MTWNSPCFKRSGQDRKRKVYHVCYLSDVFWSFRDKTPTWIYKRNWFFSKSTMAAFQDFCPESILGANELEAKQSTFKIDITKLPLLFRNSYSLVPKIEICIKYFSDKNLQKQPLWYADVTTSPYHQKLEQSTYASQTLFPYTCLVFYELSTFYIILLLR